LLAYAVDISSGFALFLLHVAELVSAAIVTYCARLVVYIDDGYINEQQLLCF